MRVFICGCFLLWLLAWSQLQWWQWWGLCAVLLLILGYKASLRNPKQILMLLLGIFLMALVAYLMALKHGQKQLPWYLHKQPLLVSGCYEILHKNQYPLQLHLYQPRVMSQLTSESVTKVWQQHSLGSGYLKLSIYDADLIKALKNRTKGALVAMVKVKKPRNYLNPDGFDYVRWAQSQGQLASGYIKNELTTWNACHKPGFNWLNRGQQGFLQALEDIPHKGVGLHLWAALTAGYTGGLESRDWQVLHRTGTTHLLVISGLHIGLVAGLFMGISRGLLRLFKQPQNHAVAIWIAWAVALSYALFSGWGLPAQRAMIMLSAVMLVNRFGLAWTIWQRLLLAWSVTLLLQPNSLYSPGFWYSYLAVANLALVWRGNTSKAWYMWVWQLILSQLALLAILAPVIGFSTGGLSLVGPLINLLLIPLFGLFIVPMLLMASLLLFCLGPHHSVMHYMAIAMDGLWQCLQWLASWPYAMLNVGHWPMAVWILWIVLGILFLLCRCYWYAALGLLGVIFLQPIKATQQITVFDVGQGLSVWLQTAEHNFIYDLGDRPSNSFNLLQAVVLPTLYQAGVASLDRVYIGHWDRDHSGGLPALVSPYENITVGQWWLPQERHKELEQYIPANAHIKRCQTTSWQTIGDIRLRHLSLQQANLAGNLAGNNASCVLQVEIQGKRILFTGDIEKIAERKLVALYGHELRSDILIAPHHGSRSSSSSLFLYTVAPRVVIISAGYQNRFGHPHQDVLARYWQQDITWYNTALHGQIRLSFSPSGELLVRHAYY